MMKFIKHPLTSALILTVLTACGSSDQDQGSVSLSSKQINGVSVDGYLAGATVFADYDGDGVRDSFEPSATTDSDGYFSYNPLTETDYCASTASDLEQASCLKVSSDTTNVTIRSIGGYDKSTGEQSTARLAVKATLSASGAQQVLISPLSSVIAAANDNQKANLLTALDISEDDLTTDFLSATKGVQSSNSTDRDHAAELLRKAVAMQSVVSAIANRLQDQYTEVGNNDKLASDAGAYVYKALAGVVLTANSVDDVLSSSTHLSSVATAAQVTLRSDYTAKEITLPSAISSTVLDTVGARATQVNSVINTVFTNNLSTVNLDNVNAGLRAIGVIATKVNNETLGTSDTSIDTAVSLFNSNSTIRNAVITALNSDQYDLSTLVDDDFTDTAGLAAKATLSDDTSGFTAGGGSTDAASVLSGKSLRVNNPDNAIPSKYKHGRIEFYFGTTTGKTKSGPLTACIRYIEGTAASDPDGTASGAANDADLKAVNGDKNNNTRGTYATGTWELLDDTGYRMQLNLKITDSGSPYHTRITSVNGAEGRRAFKFNFAGSDSNKRSDAEWLSVDGVSDAPSTLPTTNAACKQRLTDVPDTTLNGG